MAITISSVLTAAALLCSGGMTAFADETTASYATFYPETFEACAISDYAVNGAEFAFATDKKIAVYGEGKPEYYEFGVDISALDVYGGEFCYKTAGGLVYDFNGNQLQHAITETELPVSVGGYSYTLQDGNVKIWDGTEYVIDGDFSRLKVFGNVVYALNGNVLNKITPPDAAEAINYELADFSATYKIAVGETAAALDAYNLEKPHFTALNDGEYLTEVYLDKENFDKAKITAADFFKVGKTVKVGEESGFAANASALVLCETGNAHIIALNGKFYLKLASSVTTRDLTEPDFVSAQINAPSDYIYSSPNLCDAVRLFAVDWGASVKVIGKLTKASSPELACDFYKVALTDGNGNVLTDESGNELVGYTPCPFVSEKIVNNTENKTDDPDPSNANNVKTVILVLLVVVLVLAALGYITFVFTSGKRRKNK